MDRGFPEFPKETAEQFAAKTPPFPALPEVNGKFHRKTAGKAILPPVYIGISCHKAPLLPDKPGVFGANIPDAAGHGIGAQGLFLKGNHRIFYVIIVNLRNDRPIGPCRPPYHGSLLPAKYYGEDIPCFDFFL
jgi:hypothetical protein